MSDYELLKGALKVMRPEAEKLSRDLFIHALTIIIDGWCSKRNMSCTQKCELVKEIYKAFIELKENV